MRVGILLLLVVLAFGANTAMAFPTIQNTLTPSYGTLTWSIVCPDAATVITSDWSAQQHLGTSLSDPTYAYVTGGSVDGATSIIGTVTATTWPGTGASDFAQSVADFGIPLSPNARTDVTNLNLYGYLTNNVAWTGIYTESVTSDDITFIGSASTRGNGLVAGVPGYQRSGFTWDTASTLMTPTKDFHAEQVYITNQAGGSFNSAEFPVGAGNTFLGEGTYAMSNVESGSFSIRNVANAPTDSWTLNGLATNFDSAVLPGTTNALLGPQVFRGAPLTFTVNSVAMNYADAALTYSNTDLGVAAVANLARMDDTALATYNGYMPRTTQFLNDNVIQNDRSANAIDNVFTYAYVNVPDNTITADIVYY